MDELKEILRWGGWSLVIKDADGTLRCYRERGVADLYRLLGEEPALLRGAWVADKVVGRGAAGLMIIGGVSRVHADTASTPALELLRGAGVEVTCDKTVPYIANRDKTGWCPVERMCAEATTAEEIYGLIKDFFKSK